MIRSKLLVDEGGPDAAERDAEEALECFRAVGERWGQFEALSSLSEVFAVRGAYREAAAVGEEAIGVAEQLGAREELPILLILLAETLELAGEHTLARAKVERAMELARRLALFDSLAYGHAVRALIARRGGDLAAARLQLEVGLGELSTGHRHTGPPMLHARLLTDLGVITVLEGDPQRAQALHLDAFELSAGAQDTRAVALAVEGLAGAVAASGDGEAGAERAAALLGIAGALRVGFDAGHLGEHPPGGGQVLWVDGAGLQELPADLGLQLVGGAAGDHAAVVDHGDAVGELVGLIQVLGGEQHCGAAGEQLADHHPDLDAASRVQAGGGLVQEQHARLADQAGGQVEAAAHPARVALDQLAGGLRQVEALQQLVGPAPRRGPGQVEQAPMM